VQFPKTNEKSFMEKEKYKKIFIWIAIGILALFTNFWAFWGINENIHEGWYFVNL
jgi:hypothetical protein